MGLLARDTKSSDAIGIRRARTAASARKGAQKISEWTAGMGSTTEPHHGGWVCDGKNKYLRAYLVDERESESPSNRLGLIGSAEISGAAQIAPQIGRADDDSRCGDVSIGRLPESRLGSARARLPLSPLHSARLARVAIRKLVSLEAPLERQCFLAEGL